MRKLILLIIFVAAFQSILFAQTGFYEWISHSSKELISSRGMPEQIFDEKGDSMYIYRTELGYSSFFIKNDLIYKTNNSTYWKKKAKAKSAFDYLLNLYKNDGFTVGQKKKDTVNLSNSKYTVKLEMYFSENLYAASETVTQIKREDEK